MDTKLLGILIIIFGILSVAYVSYWFGKKQAYKEILKSLPKRNKSII